MIYSSSRTHVWWSWQRDATRAVSPDSSSCRLVRESIREHPLGDRACSHTENSLTRARREPKQKQARRQIYFHSLRVRCYTSQRNFVIQRSATRRRKGRFLPRPAPFFSFLPRAPSCHKHLDALQPLSTFPRARAQSPEMIDRGFIVVGFSDAPGDGKSDALSK